MAAQEDQFVAFVPCGSRRPARKAAFRRDREGGRVFICHPDSGCDRRCRPRHPVFVLMRLTRLGAASADLGFRLAMADAAEAAEPAIRL